MKPGLNPNYIVVAPLILITVFSFIFVGLHGHDSSTPTARITKENSHAKTSELTASVPMILHTLQTIPVTGTTTETPLTSSSAATAQQPATSPNTINDSSTSGVQLPATNSPTSSNATQSSKGITNILQSAQNTPNTAMKTLLGGL
jgi:hypothetical protein